MNAGSRRPIFDGHNDALLKLAPFATDDLQRFLDGGTSSAAAERRRDASRSMMSRMSRGQHLLQKIATLSV